MTKKKKSFLLSIIFLIFSLITAAFLLLLSGNDTTNSDSNYSEEALNDLNLYLKSQSLPPVQPQNLNTISNYKLFDKLQNKENILVLDVREDHEWEVNRLPDEFSNIKHIRLGDLLTAKDVTDKETQVVIISFGNSRANQAALYLLSKGYTNVSVLEGGIMQWGIDNFPMAINNYQSDKNISQVLTSIDPDNPVHGSAQFLSFGPASIPNNIQAIYWDTQRLNDFITSLSSEQPFIIFCQDDKYCYEALFFYHHAKSKVNIVGYTQNR